MPGIERMREAMFWARVDKRDGDGCWMWLGAKTPHGYGKVMIRGRYFGAHKQAYMLTHGPVPKGLFVMHDCDTPLCVRPDHLRLGTPADNVADMMRKGRMSPPPKATWRGEEVPGAKLNTAAVREIRVAYANGQSTLALGEQYGVSPTLISLIVRGRIWKHVEVYALVDGRTRRQRGMNRPGAKLTDDDVRTIRSSTETGLALAAQFGVASTQIYSVRKGRTWKHVV